jgi:hypothetical protein
VLSVAVVRGVLYSDLSDTSRLSSTRLREPHPPEC